MKGKEADETLRKICSACGKRISSRRRAGSLTGYLFGGADCTCSQSSEPAKAPKSNTKDQLLDEGEFCSRCGLQIVPAARDGSLTGFLLQSTRCKCPPDHVFADGAMSAKFWKLKQAGGGTIFSTTSAGARPAMAASVDLAPGAIIGGVYKIIKLLGRGGMGEVYLASHETMDKKCALKVIPPDQVTEIGWQRFQLEAKAVAKLEHINLVRVTDLGIHDGCLPYYAMDYVEGQNLAELLVEQGPMPLKTVLEIVKQVCDGVECAHRGGILHRDLKPANIMLVAAAKGPRQVEVLDFGLAKLSKHDRTQQSLTAVGDVFGSPFYMSPEQCNGERLDHRSDIYALGCTMFECLTGRPPFVGNLAGAIMASHMEADPPSLESVVGAHKFPPSMEVVMAMLLRKNPAERYQTLPQLKADLELVLRGEDVQPIYVSRDRSDRDRDKDKARKSSDVISTQPSEFSIVPLLLGAGFCFLILAGGASYYFLAARHASKADHLETVGHAINKSTTALPNNETVEGGDSAPPDLPVEPKPDPDATPQGALKRLSHWSRQPFYQGIILRNGKQYNQWRIPRLTSDSLRIQCENASALTDSHPGLKRNEYLPDLFTPIDATVRVTVSPAIVEHQELLKGLTDGTFSTIWFRDCSLAEVRTIMPLLDDFRSIQFVMLGDLDWSGADSRACVGIINQFHRLRGLGFGCQVEGKGLTELNRLAELKQCWFYVRQADLRNDLTALVAAKNLEELGVESWSGTLDDLALLLQYHRLKRLYIGGLRGSHEQLAILSQIPALEHVNLPGLNNRTDLVADLRALKCLKGLVISDHYSWTNAQISNLKEQLPGVGILLKRQE